MPNGLVDLSHRCSICDLEANVHIRSSCTPSKRVAVFANFYLLCLRLLGIPIKFVPLPLFYQLFDLLNEREQIKIKEFRILTGLFVRQA